jgi:hypothetical protein
MTTACRDAASAFPSSGPVSFYANAKLDSSSFAGTFLLTLLVEAAPRDGPVRPWRVLATIALEAVGSESRERVPSTCWAMAAVAVAAGSSTDLRAPAAWR